MMVNKYKARFYSGSSFTILLGVLFGLVYLSNVFNFRLFTLNTSDVAPFIRADSTISQIQSTSSSPDSVNISTSMASTVAQPVIKYAVASASSYFSIGGKNIAFYNAVNGTEDDAGNRIARYSDTFYYGHNSSSVFGMLPSLPIGSTFSITSNGATKTYKIAATETFEKIGSNILTTASDPNHNFSNGIYSARYQGQQYSIALMTCAGRMLGGGDATHRYVVFAYEI